MGSHLPTLIWKWTLPIRWPLSMLLWLLSRCLQGLSAAFWGMHVAVGFARLIYLDYSPRPDDIFVVTYPRSGTTWLQMILYQLTTDGEMEFAHIGEVCPWFERVALNHRDLEALPSPRVFKSHLPYWCLPPRVPKRIYVAREGKDVAVSYYHFLKSHFRYRGDFSQFFNLFMRGWVPWGSWFSHTRGWWRRREDPRVLFLRYEELSDDLEGCIRRIIKFCNLEVPEERIPLIVERCSFSTMKRFEEKFDFATEHMLELGYTPRTFIRRGVVGDWQSQFDKQQEEKFERTFHRRLASRGLRFDTDPEARG